MKKAFDQTFRDIKRGVNKKVLKVPSIEQKVLDATSNEPWGPHGTHLAVIAQASRNYHEYQMIMSVVWKRLNDTGKNWRHVFKALTVLEYLVANGSERVIEDIREHVYQISTLSSFQYIDSSGRDQGSNVRKKSQSLVALVNDKEKIKEAREKAAASRDKFRDTSGGPGDDRYEGRYGSRDEDLNGYGREREWGYTDPYARDGEDRYGRDGYRDDEYRGRSRNVDGDYGPRSRSSDRDRDRERAYEDDGHHSSRGSNAKVEDGSLDGRGVELTPSGQHLGAPPSYEDAVSESHSPNNIPPPAANHTPPPSNSVAQPPTATTAPPATATPPPAAATPPPDFATPPQPAVPSNMENEGFDLFDPRGVSSAAPPASGGAAEMDLLGSLSDAFSSNALALVPSEPQAPPTSNPSHTFVAASLASQQFDNPFGDGPFKAIPSTDGFSAQPPPSPFTATAEPTPFGDGPFKAIPSTEGFSAQPPPPPFAVTAEPPPFGDGPFKAIPSTDGISAQTPPSSFATTAEPPPFGDGPFKAIPYTDGFSAQPPPSPFATTAEPPPFGDDPFKAIPSTDGFSAQPPPSPFAVTAEPTPFGDGPFKAIASTDGFSAQLPPSPFTATAEQPISAAPTSVYGNNSGFGNTFDQTIDILADILPPPAPLQTAFQDQPGQLSRQPVFHTQTAQPSPQPFSQTGFSAPPTLPPGFPGQFGQPTLPANFPSQGGQPMQQPGFPPQGVQSIPQQSFSAQGGQTFLARGFPAQGGQPVMHPGFGHQGGQNASLSDFSTHLISVSQAGFPGSGGQHSQSNNFHRGSQPQDLAEVTTAPAPQYNGSNLYQQPQLQSSSVIASSQSAITVSTGALAIVPQQPAKEKFETKSTVWADTLNRGLVNLNISGSKTNPLSDIGIDFEAINRKEKRMEKPSKTPVTSNVTMGKAMGSGSGIGRAGAGALRPTPNQMVGSGMGLTMGGLGYGGVNQPIGMNNMPQSMGNGMNIGQGFPMQQPPPAPGFLPGNYHPMLGRGGGYGQQQPYGGYR